MDPSGTTSHVPTWRDIAFGLVDVIEQSLELLGDVRDVGVVTAFARLEAALEDGTISDDERADMRSALRTELEQRTTAADARRVLVGELAGRVAGLRDALRVPEPETT